MFFGMIILADDRQLFHIKTGFFQFLNSLFRFGVSVVNRDD